MADFFDAPKKKGGRPKKEAPLPPPADGLTPPIPIPPMTAGLAAELAAFQHAGMSQTEALLYLLPGVDEDTLGRLAIRWSRHPLVLEAVATLNGGAWETLERRVACLESMSRTPIRHQSAAREHSHRWNSRVTLKVYGIRSGYYDD